MSKKKKTVQIAHLPEQVQLMLSRVNPLVSIKWDTTLTHYRDDAVFILLQDQEIQPYTLARLVLNNPDIYFEVMALAPGYVELRCFCSNWMREHETSVRLPLVQKQYHAVIVTGAMKCQED